MVAAATVNGELDGALEPVVDAFIATSADPDQTQRTSALTTRASALGAEMPRTLRRMRRVVRVWSPVVTSAVSKAVRARVATSLLFAGCLIAVVATLAGPATAALATVTPSSGGPRTSFKATFPA